MPQFKIVPENNGWYRIWRTDGNDPGTGTVQLVYFHTFFNRWQIFEWSGSEAQVLGHWLIGTKIRDIGSSEQRKVDQYIEETSRMPTLREYDPTGLGRQEDMIRRRLNTDQRNAQIVDDRPGRIQVIPEQPITYSNTWGESASWTRIREAAYRYTNVLTGTTMRWSSNRPEPAPAVEPPAAYIAADESPAEIGQSVSEAIEQARERLERERVQSEIALRQAAYWAEPYALEPPAIREILSTPEHRPPVGTPEPPVPEYRAMVMPLDELDDYLGESDSELSS